MTFAKKTIDRSLTSGLAVGVIGALAAWGVPSASAQSCAATPPAMTAWWPANGNATDIIANHRGTLNGGVTFAPGVVGAAFDFDGSSGYVEVPTSPALQPPSAISLAAWIYPTALPASPYSAFMIGKYNSFDMSQGVSWSVVLLATGQIQFEVREQTYVYWDATTVGSVTLDQWQHMAATFDTSTQAMAIYVNGAAVPISMTGTGPVTSIYQSTAAVMFGATYAGFTDGLGSYYAGLIDEAQIFGVALTPSQVAAISAAGSSGVCPPTWRASHPYFKGDEVHDPAKHIQAVETAGTSGVTRPSWNDAGGTTSDGTVVWKDRGLEP